MNASRSEQSDPQGLKPAFLLVLNGTAEAVPYPKPFVRPTRMRNDKRRMTNAE